MDKKELHKAQNIIDALFYDDKALTQWQHTLLENVISIAQTKLRQPDVSGRSELLVSFLKWYVKDEMMRKEKELITSIVERYLNETNSH